jgi:hypothetical protein
MNALRFGAAGLVLGACWAGAQGVSPPATYPQIVRVSYAQGDVRVSRGKAGEKVTGAPWEKAEADLPLAAGFSLVTGKGRAEIEFEDASVAYLGEDSVLVFNELSSTGGVPRTNMALLSGTLSLDVQARMRGELFAVETPTDALLLRYPDQAQVRVNSYLDAMTLTMPGYSVFSVDGIWRVHGRKDLTLTFAHSELTHPEQPVNSAESAAWDDWVAQQIQTRDAATSATMREAGLTQPIPGLAEMQGQGTFSDCAPYGKCWEPKDGSAAAQQIEAQEQPAALTRQTVSVSALQQGGVVRVAQNGGVGPNVPIVEDDFFPCTPFHWRNYLLRDPVTGQMRVVRRSLVPGDGGYPYEWAVCHAGTWIHRRHHYVWVAGTKRHHHHPVKWVQVGKTKGFVPIHPLDKAGGAPLNLKNGLFHATDKKGESVEQIAYAEGDPVKLLAEAPKEFRKETYVPLARAEAPRVDARALLPARAGETKPMVAAITFDHKLQGFVMAGQAAGGGRTFVQPIGSRGTSQLARGGGANYSGGGASGASRTMASSSGGANSASHASAPASAPAASSSAASSSGRH